MIGLFGEGRSETKKKIINELLSGRRSLKELSEKIGVSKQALLKHLDKMEGRGIVKSQSVPGERGKIKKYGLGNYSAMISIDERGFVVHFEVDSPLDSQFPLVNQISQEKYKEEVLSYLEKLPLEKDNLNVILFGSVARGEATWKSDIDVAFVSSNWSEENKLSIKDEISEVSMQKEVESSMNPHFVTFEELNEGGGITDEIKKDGIIIYDSGSDEIWEKMERYRSI